MRFSLIMTLIIFSVILTSIPVDSTINLHLTPSDSEGSKSIGSDSKSGSSDRNVKYKYIDQRNFNIVRNSI